MSPPCLGCSPRRYRPELQLGLNSFDTCPRAGIILMTTRRTRYTLARHDRAAYLNGITTADHHDPGNKAGSRLRHL